MRVLAERLGMSRQGIDRATFLADTCDRYPILETGTLSAGRAATILRIAGALDRLPLPERERAGRILPAVPLRQAAAAAEALARLPDSARTEIYGLEPTAAAAELAAADPEGRKALRAIAAAMRGLRAMETHVRRFGWRSDDELLPALWVAVVREVQAGRSAQTEARP